MQGEHQHIQCGQTGKQHDHLSRCCPASNGETLVVFAGGSELSREVLTGNWESGGDLGGHF